MNSAYVTDHSKKGPLIWSLDPFDVECRPYPATVAALVNWARAEDRMIQPVHVFSIPAADFEVDKKNSWVPRYIPFVQKMMATYLKELGVQEFLNPEVLVEKSSSRSKAVAKLVEFSEERSSPMTIISSHGRSGMNRLVFGSFAENLLHESKQPVFFLDYSSKLPQKRFDRVLFPTDFSDASRMAFREWLPHAKALGAEVILFHVVSLPPMVAPGYGMIASTAWLPESYFSEQSRWANAEGEKWKDEARELNVPVRSIIKDAGISSATADWILRTAQEEAVTMIAMASVSQTVSAFIAGSVACDIFRKHQYPVWVMGPAAIEGRQNKRQLGWISAQQFITMEVK